MLLLGGLGLAHYFYGRAPRQPVEPPQRAGQPEEPLPEPTLLAPSDGDPAAQEPVYRPVEAPPSPLRTANAGRAALRAGDAEPEPEKVQGTALFTSPRLGKSSLDLIGGPAGHQNAVAVQEQRDPRAGPEGGPGRGPGVERVERRVRLGGEGGDGSPLERAGTLVASARQLRGGALDEKRGPQGPQARAIAEERRVDNAVNRAVERAGPNASFEEQQKAAAAALGELNLPNTPKDALRAMGKAAAAKGSTPSSSAVDDGTPKPGPDGKVPPQPQQAAPPDSATQQDFQGIPTKEGPQAPPSGSPMWTAFYQRFTQCRPDPSCEPTKFHIFRPGSMCHSQSKAMDLFAMKCADGLHTALQNGKFAQMVQCVRGKGMKVLWRECHINCGSFNVTNYHYDHGHFSVGCPGPPW